MDSVHWYNQEFPSKGDIVMAKVVSVDEAGARCILMEYGCKEAFVPLSESIKKRGRSWVKVGCMKEMQVLSVDPSKRQIDLSPRYVTPQEAAECADYFEKSRRVHNLLKHLAEENNLEIIDLYNSFIYSLKENPWDILASIAKQPKETQLDFAASIYGESIRDSKVFASLLNIVTHQMSAKQVKLEAQFNVTCFSDDGVIAIRSALQAGLDASSNETIKLQLVSSPTFSASCVTDDPKSATKVIEGVIKAIKDSIQPRGGKCEVIKEIGIAEPSN